MADSATVDMATRQQLAARLDRLDRDGSIAVADGVMAAGTAFDLLVTGLLVPAQAEVGRRWATDEIGAVEAQATIPIVRAALLRAGPATTPAGRPLVAVGCPHGEHHGLAAEMVTELLRARGWPAQSIGGGLPAADLRRYLERSQPAALLLSCSTPCGLAGAALAIDVAHGSDIPVMVGGAGFGPDHLRALRLGADGWASSVGTATEILDRWQTKPPQLPRERVLSDAYVGFESALLELRGAVLEKLQRSELRRSGDATDFGPVPDRVDLLLAHLGAALLVDDGRLLLDFLSWHLAFLDARGVSAQPLSQAIDIVSAVLPREQSRAHRLLEEGYQHVRWTGSADATRSAKARRPRRTDPALRSVAPARPVAPIAGPVAALGAEPGAEPGAGQGQVFADLLLLATMSCHAPIALISVPQPEGPWSTLSYGVERREALDDPDLFSLVESSDEPVEIQDLSQHDSLGAGPLATGPLAIRFVYGIPLRSRQGANLAVLCILDRRAREFSRREGQAMLAIARQLADHLVLWRQGAGAAEIDGRPGPADPPGTPDRPPGQIPLADLVGLRGTGLGLQHHLLRSHEVAVLFDVTERTVINWAASSKLPSIRTAGGHLRFRREDVMSLLDDRTGTATR